MQVKFVGASAILKAIASIQTRGKKLDQDIQDAGLSCLAHIDQHGDVGPMNRLYLALPAGSRKSALMDWAQTYGKVQPNLDAKSNKEAPFLYDKAGSTDLQAASDKPWYKHKPEKPIEVEFDLRGKILQLVKQAEKAQAKGTPIKGAELLLQLQTAAGAN